MSGGGGRDERRWGVWMMWGESGRGVGVDVGGLQRRGRPPLFTSPPSCCSVYDDDGFSIHRQDSSCFEDIHGTKEEKVAGYSNTQIFSYAELYICANDFGDSEVLGSGGFDRIYRVVLPTDGTVVAIKCVANRGDHFEKTFAVVTEWRAREVGGWGEEECDRRWGDCGGRGERAKTVSDGGEWGCDRGRLRWRGRAGGEGEWRLGGSGRKGEPPLPPSCRRSYPPAALAFLLPPPPRRCSRPPFPRRSPLTP